jgi:exodeoxyribonuclease-3
MRIATWNINGLRARLDFLRGWLADRQPDVVGLQELKMTDEAFPAEAFAEMGYHVLTHGQKAWNGVAVLSREPATLQTAGLPGQEEMGARLLTATVGELNFTTVYCPNGKSIEHEDYGRKLAWFDALKDHLDSAKTASGFSVLCGDFNICVTDLDAWNESALAGGIFQTAAERQRMHGLFDLGLTDMYRTLNPEARTYSWWDYRAGAFQRNNGLRIDLMLASNGAAMRTTEVWVDRDYRKKKDGMTASDHAPVVLELAESQP